eukprot:1145656-Pelagomonas_calceolata.AAC.1
MCSRDPCNAAAPSPKGSQEVASPLRLKRRKGGPSGGSKSQFLCFYTQWLQDERMEASAGSFQRQISGSVAREAVTDTHYCAKKRYFEGLQNVVEGLATLRSRS